MIRGKEQFLTKLYVSIDILVIQIAFFVAWMCRFYFLDGTIATNLPLSSYYFWNIIYSVSYVVIAFLISLYIPKRKKRFTIEITKVIQANLLSMFVLLSILFIVRTVDISRLFLVFYFSLNISLITVYRYMVKIGLWKLRSKGFNKQFVLILGAGSIGKRYMQNLMNHPEYGLEILGFLDDFRTKDCKGSIDQFKILGKVKDLENILTEKIVDEVVVALPLTAYPKYQQIISICEKAGVRTSIVPDFYDILPASPHFERFGDLPIINARDIPLDEFVNRIFKRAFDIVFSIVAICITSPLLLIIAIGVKVSSPGPILFKQERVGLNRRTFMMYKFRSMKQMSETISDTQWTVENDPRRTKFGTFIRKTSLDELPQFFNVLKGDMSVVGPRPERPYFVEQFKEEIPKYMIKHQVRPGITGWAQVCGLRGDTSIKERIEHDIYYIENWKLLLDVKIILKTVLNGLINKNAY